MSVQFWPCPACSRHVKRGEAICPFCGATASGEGNPTRTFAATRLSRAALFAAGTIGAAVATTTCGNATTILPPYGGAPYFPNEDASASDGPNEAAADAGDSSMTTGPTDSSSAPDVPMGFSILYGAAIIPDE